MDDIFFKRYAFLNDKNKKNYASSVEDEERMQMIKSMSKQVIMTRMIKDQKPINFKTSVEKLDTVAVETV